MTTATARPDGKTIAAAQKAAGRLVDGKGRTLADSEAFVEAGWSEQDIRAEVDRQKAVRDLQERAGTSDDREAARIRAEQAAVTLAEQGGVLRAEIAERQERLGALEDAAETARREVVRRSEALDHLRRLAPKRVRERVAMAREAIEQKHRPLILPLETEITNVEALQRIDLGRPIDRQSAVLHAEAAKPALIVTTGRDNKRDVSPERWAAYVADRAANLPELRERLTDLREQRDAALAEADRQLDVYAR